MSEMEMGQKETGQNDFVESVNWPALNELIEDKIEEHEERSDPKQVRDVVPIDDWISYYYIGSPADTIYPFWEDTIKEFIGEGYNELIIDGSLGSGKCVHEESEVRLADGTCKQIQYVNAGDNVVSVDDSNLKFEASEVNEVIDSGIKPVYEVTLQNGKQVIVTGCHPFLTPSGWKKIDDGLQEGGFIAHSGNDQLGFGGSSVKGSANYGEIQSIEYVGKKSVYDLEIEGTHNFIANGIVVHNTWTAMLILMRKIYELTCYEYPQRLFGFSDNTKINFAYLSVKNNIARNTGFSDLKGHIEGSPYFQDEFPRDDSIETKLRWPDRNIEANYGSTGSSIIGSNLLACTIDEANFWKRGGGDPGDVEAVRDVYKDATHRRRNRFMSDGEDPGFSVLISSSSSAKSFIEQRKRKAGEGNYLHVKARNYNVKPWEYSDEKFIVFAGTDKLSPEIVSTPQQYKSILDDLDVDWQEIYDDGEIENLENSSYQNQLIGQRVEWLVNRLPDRIEENFIVPPYEYWDDFQSGIYSALQDIGGEATGESGKFFSNAEVWNDCQIHDVDFPFTKEQFTIGMNSPRRISDYFKPHIICDFVEERDGKKYFKPSCNPGHGRYLHIDLSSANDPTGIAMCHIDGYEEGPDGEISLPHLHYDFMIRLTTPEHPDRLDHQKIRKFIYRLNNRYGFTFRKIGMDKHASESNLQLFDKNVFDKKSNRGDDDYGACYNSTDSSDDMWTDFVDLMYAGNVRFAEYDVFHKEFFGLENQGADNPPDHPDEFDDGSTGHNDVSCAVVGASALAYESDEDLSDRYTENQTNKKAPDDPQSNWKGSHGLNPFKSERERVRDMQDQKIMDLHNSRS